MAKAKTVKMKLGDIEERGDLRPRPLSTEAIQDYVRMLRNGETPPPIELHAGSRTIFDGHHRFHAYKAFWGDGWREHQVVVILREDLPDPEQSPMEFRWQAALRARGHGVRLSRYDKKALISSIVANMGIDEAVSRAPAIAETSESVRELIDAMAIAGISMTAAVVSPSDATADGEQPGQFVPGVSKWRGESHPTGTLQGWVPGLKRLCQALTRLLGQMEGPLIDRDRLLLEELREAIEAALEREAEAEAV